MVRTWIGTLRFVICASKASRNARNPIRATHRGQRPAPAAATGRIHDRSRPHAATAKFPLPNGGRPYMTTCSERPSQDTSFIRNSEFIN
jgi:hypothetical protein